MFRVAAALGAAMVIALVASAVRGQAQNVDGRFQLTAEDEGFLRLDTQTGALSFCQLEDGRWACVPVETEDAPDFNVILDRISALEAALVELAARLEQPDTAVRVQLEAITAQLEALIDADTPEIDAPEVDPLLRDEIAALTAGQIELAQAVEAAARRNDLETILGELSVLNERIAALEASLAARVAVPTTPTLAELQENIVAVVQLGDVLDQRLDELAAGDIEIADQLSVLNTRLDEIEGRLLAGITQAGGGGDAAVVEIRSLLETIVERQREIDGEIAALVATVDPGEGVMTTALAEELAAFREWQAATDSQLLGLFEAIDRLSESFSSRLAEAVAPLSEGHIAFETQLTTIAWTIEEITSTGTEFVEAIAAVEERQIAVEGRLVALADAIEAGDPLEAAFVSEAFGLMQREMGDLRAAIVSISENVTAQITALSAEINTVNAKIGGLPAPVDLATDLARIESELRALRDLLVEPVATGPDGDGIETVPDNAATNPTADNPDTLADEGAAGFGEQLFLRLEDLVGDLRRGLRGD